MRKHRRRPFGSGTSDSSQKKKTTSSSSRRNRSGSGTSSQSSSNRKKKKKRSGGSSSRSGRSGKKSPKFLKFHLRKYNQMVKIDLNNYEIIGKGSFGIVFITRLIYLNESPLSPVGNLSPFNRLTSPPSPTSAPFINPPQEQYVAIKRVFQDERYKNRELEIMKLLNKDFQHYNLVGFYYYFYEEDRSFRGGNHKRYLNIVMEYLPDQTLYHFYKKLNATNTHNPSLFFPDAGSNPPKIQYNFSRNSKEQIYFFLKTEPMKHLFLIKIFMYQLVKSVNYLHCLDICHRDIKFQNILLGLTQQSVKLCDFGSAKILQPSEKNISYICSRYYRAPELIFGHRNYNYKIDNWSIGCVFGEMLLMGRPLFKGENSNDQILKIIHFLGSPNQEESLFLFQKNSGGGVQGSDGNNSNFKNKFPSIKKENLVDYFSRKSPRFFKRLPPEEQKLTIDMLETLVTYDAKNRVDLLLLLGHPFFDAIKVTGRSNAPFKVNPNIFKFHLMELRDWKKKIRNNQHLISDYIKKGIRFGQLKKILNFQ